MRRTAILFLLLFLFRPLAAQSVRGVSSPGSLGLRKAKPEHGVSDMVCTLSFDDTNGDGVLSEGEVGIADLLIRNWNEKTTVRPKIEIFLGSGDLEKSRLWIEYLGPLGPGEAKSYRHYFSWDEGLPFGTVIYQVNIFETETGYRTPPVEFQFDIVGGGSIPISD